ncbi:MAG TPA: 16S rRNA (cytosine(1402)-N(4))-methyltransferase RsmH [Gemmatimonadaceae bacterium]
MATDWSSAYHAPVLPAEVLGFVGDAKVVVDGTLGGGGHALAMLEHGVGRVVGIDRDPEAAAAAQERLDAYIRKGRLEIVAGNYADPAVLQRLPADIDAVLLDLGVSSRQLDDPDRGFTFREGAPLDMRMDSEASVDAAGWLASVDERTLADVLHDYGDESKAYRMAREIVRRRENRPFTTSDDLVGAIRAVLGARSGPGDFARIFQAIRIAVNDELTGLSSALPAFRDRLVGGGRLVVIAYHSGEDRIVKNAFRDWSSDCVCPPKQPVCTCRGRALGKTLTRKAVTAGPIEMAANSRSRSARLRAWQKAQ